MSAASERLVAIDWMRGFVIVLMAVDHASEAFNAGRFMTDGPYDIASRGSLGHAAAHVAVPHALVHAPVRADFVFLAGRAGARPRAASRAASAGHRPALVARGLLIAPGGCGSLWSFAPAHVMLFQVLYAIGPR